MKKPLSSAALIAALLTLLAGTAAASKPVRLDVELRYVTVVHDINDAFVTGNDRWLHVHDIDLAMVGAGTIGGDEYLSEASATARSHTSMADDPSLPPGSGEEGNIHLRDGVATFDPIAGGERVTCEGWIHLARVPVTGPFPSSSEGDFRWRCDNGWKIRGTVDAHYELDPALGIPVFAIYVTGEAR